MESLQKLFTPTLEDLISKIQQADAPNGGRKKPKRPIQTEDTSQRKKRNRITFDTFQVDEMEKVFAINQYPDAISRDKLATKIQLDEERVQIWFQNRRAKYRRELRHTYHPFEPAKNGDIPFFQKVLIPGKTDKDTPSAPTESAIQKEASPERDHPPMTNKKTSLPVSEEIEDQSIFMKALGDSSDDSASSGQLATSLSLLLCASQNADQNVCVVDASHVDNGGENTTAAKEEEETLEQLDPEKARLLLWALSSIFNVQNDTKA